MKKMLAAIVALCLLIAPAMSLADEATVKETHVITTAISSDPVTMDVLMNNVTPGNTVTGMLFGGLFKWSEDGTSVVPCYAKDYTVSGDGLTYTITMKDDIFFSDGTPMDASDVYYSYMHTLDPKTASTLTTDLWSIKNAKAYCKGEIADPAEVGIKLVDEKTLEFTIEYPAAWFLSQACVLDIVKEGIYEENPNWWKDPATYVCSGPFMLDSYNPLEVYHLKKNPYYENAANIQVEGVDVVIIEAPETELTAYRNGEIDVSTNLSVDAINEYKGSDEYFTVDRLGIQYCDFNCQLPEFKDPRVRRAFAISIDREWILESILETDQKALYGFVPYSQPSLTDPTKSYRDVAGDLFVEDVEEAQRLMAEAGYPNGEGFPEVELVVRATDEQKNFAQALQSLWQENLGVTVTIRTVEASSTYWDELADGKFSIDRSGYTQNYIDPSANLVIWKSGGNAFENQWPDDEGRTEYNEMFDAAQAMTDPAEREQALIAAEKYLVEMMPGFPVYSYNTAYLVKPYIQNLNKGVAGSMTWEYITFAE